jgi:hypothetical protein
MLPAATILAQVHEEIKRYNGLLLKLADVAEDEWEAVVATCRGELQKPFFEHMQCLMAAAKVRRRTRAAAAGAVRRALQDHLRDASSLAAVAAATLQARSAAPARAPPAGAQPARPLPRPVSRLPCPAARSSRARRLGWRSLCC